MTDLNKEREQYESVIEKTQGIKMEHLVGISFNAESNQYEISGEKWACELTDACEELNTGWFIWQECVKAKAQAVPDTHLLVEKSKIETWWQDAEEPENFASRIEDMPSLGQYINGNEIMEITEHHTIHLPSKTIYGVWVDKDGDRSFCTGTLEECQALVGRESGAEG